MPGNPNKLSQFWLELRRRNVVRVLAVYVAAAFMVLELVDMVSAPFGLPDWSLKVAFLIAVAGLIITLILSWIYDIHPEGRMVKTERVEENREQDFQPSSNNWRIASYISFAVILGLIILNVLPRNSGRSELEKSIAVLPFINDSPEEEGMYFINGTMESILNNLCKIQDLRVVSRTSVEQYRNKLKPIPEIGQEMKVAYVLEGSGLKHGDQIRLTLQLIDAANDKHIWSEAYTCREADVFELFSTVSQLVAQEIHAIITPEEEELIEKVPTTSQTAFDLYQKATDEWNDERSLELLYYSLEYDPDFSLPYVALGWKYWAGYLHDPEIFSNYLDSAILYCKKALLIDPELADAYSLKGNIYTREGKTDEAILAFDRAIQLNPNHSGAYSGKGWLYFGAMDYVNAIQNFREGILRDRTPGSLGNLHDKVAFVFSIMGFESLATANYEEALIYHGNSAWHLFRLAQMEQYAGNIQRALELSELAYDKEPDNTYGLFILGESYLLAGRFEEAFIYISRYQDISESRGEDILWHKMPIAFTYLKNGKKRKAEMLIAEQIQQANDWIANKREGYVERYAYLAMAYMLKEDKNRALENLRLMSQQERMNISLTRFPEHPIFTPIKDDPEFLEICDLINSKYLAEHERVRKWLVDNDML